MVIGVRRYVAKDVHPARKECRVTLVIHLGSGLWRAYEAMHSGRVKMRNRCIWISPIKPGGLKVGMEEVTSFQLKYFEDSKGEPACWPVRIILVSEQADLSVNNWREDLGIRLAALG